MSINYRDWSDIDSNFRKSLSGNISIVRAEDAINQSIKLLLSTMKGERVRSDLGSGLYRLLFRPMDVDTAEAMEDVIEFNIEQYEDRVVVNEVKVQPIFESHYYVVTINYSILPSMRKKTLTTYAPAMGEI